MWSEEASLIPVNKIGQTQSCGPGARWRLWLLSTWLNSHPLPPQQRPDGCLGMASDQCCPPSHAWHCFRACWLVQAKMVPSCMLMLKLHGEFQAVFVFSSLLSFTVPFSHCVLFTSYRHRQLGSLDSQWKRLSSSEDTWCWEGTGRDRMTCLLEMVISFHALFREPRLDEILNF